MNLLQIHDEMNGSTTTRINFPHELLSLDYTLFYVAKYNDDTEDIIFQSWDYNWLSGFY